MIDQRSTGCPPLADRDAAPLYPWLQASAPPEPVGCRLTIDTRTEPFLEPITYTLYVPRCPVCQYELDTWVSSDPCPECGQAPREYTHRFFTHSQRLLITLIAIAFPTAHVVLHQMSSRTLRSNAWTDLATTLGLGVIFLGPPICVFIIKDNFERGFAKGSAIAFAALSIIPTVMLNFAIQIALP